MAANQQKSSQNSHKSDQRYNKTLTLIYVQLSFFNPASRLPYINEVISSYSTFKLTTWCDIVIYKSILNNWLTS